eukprot:2015019-Rhodomonas_salina.2
MLYGIGGTALASCVARSLGTRAYRHTGASTDKRVSSYQPKYKHRRTVIPTQALSSAPHQNRDLVQSRVYRRTNPSTKITPTRVQTRSYRQTNPSTNTGVSCDGLPACDPPGRRHAAGGVAWGVA